MSKTHLVVIPVIAFGIAILIFATRTDLRTKSNGFRLAASGDTDRENDEDDPDAEIWREAMPLPAGRFHKALRMRLDFPGIVQPELEDVADVGLTDPTPVIGIEVDGAAVGFVIEKMKDPKAHIVNMNFDQKKSVSVTFCDLADCVRVVSAASDKPLELHVGGLDIDQQMVYLFKGERYGQMSADLPLEDYPFQRTTLGQWKKQHPKTLICIPSSRASIEHRHG